MLGLCTPFCICLSVPISLCQPEFHFPLSCPHSPSNSILLVTWLVRSQGRGKKDAKQVAAAALLESLLNQQGQTEADFLQPGKAKLQKAVQVVSR